MKNIITALDDSEINKILKKEENIKIICKDISYKEGILEQIEKNKDVNLVIINEEIDGEITLNKLIKKIKEKIKNVEIIIISKNKKEIMSEIYRFKKVYVYETNKIKIKKLMSMINIEDIKKEQKISKNNIKNLISISGAEATGKTLISIIFFKFNSEKNSIIIDFNSEENQDISTVLYSKRKNREKENQVEFISTNKISKVDDILKSEKYKNIIIDLGNKIQKEEKAKILKQSKKIIILIEPNLIGIKKCENILNYYLNILKIKKEKIFILINKKNKYSIDKEIIEKIFKDIKIISEIKNNIKFEKLINNKFKNYEFIFNKEEKEKVRNLIEEIF